VARWRIVTHLHQLACYRLNGQSRRSGCAPLTSSLPRQADNFRARRASHACAKKTQGQFSAWPAVAAKIVEGLTEVHGAEPFAMHILTEGGPIN
jgi:hypothetical protein